MKLSLDDPLDWASILPKSINEAIKNEAEDGLARVCVDLREVKCPTGKAGSVLSFLKEAVIPKITHVTGFHGCRIADEASYLKHGILRSGFDIHLAELRKRHPEKHVSIEEELRKLGPDYAAKSRNNVHLLLSKSVAFETDYGMQHTQGSEIVSTISGRIGIADHTSPGKSAFIECTIPSELVHQNRITGMTIASFLYWLTRIRGISSEPDPREAGFSVAADIRSSWMCIHYLAEKPLNECLKPTPNPNQKSQ